ncbi:MAG: cation-transporting P-type ATPase [Chlorobiales bacterium]
MEATFLAKESWYALESTESLEKTSANLQTGLTTEEAQKRKAKYSPNVTFQSESAKPQLSSSSNNSINHWSIFCWLPLLSRRF